MSTQFTDADPSSDLQEGETAVETKAVTPDEWDNSLEVLDLPAVDHRERALPIRPGDLTRLLMSQPSLSPDEKQLLGQLGRMLGATFHAEFYERLRDLKERYAVLDPDSDYINIEGCGPVASADPSSSFLELFETTLERANYQPLTLDIIKAAVEAPNEIGLTYVPDFNMFDHLRIYARGYTRITRQYRTVKTKFRKQTITLDAYQRLIIALKFRPDVKRLGSHIRSDVLYLRMFKDVPHVDMEMHLPEQGTRVRMRKLDLAQIASPFAVSIPTMILKGVGLITVGGVGALAGLVVAPISASVNSFFGFQRAKQKHLSHMIRSLYYMTLANNASVLTRLIDSAEEEEYKETLLSYFFLWQSTSHRQEPMNKAALDRSIESFLREHTGVEINFEINDALGKLFRLGLATRDQQGRVRARPISEALAHLDRLWDNTFHFVPPKSAEGAEPTPAE